MTIKSFLLLVLPLAVVLAINNY